MNIHKCYTLLQLHSSLKEGDSEEAKPCRCEESREETGSGGQANPTSTEAVEAMVQSLKNNYLTFKDRGGGIEQK